MHRFRIYVDIAVVVLVLVLTNLIAHFTTPWAKASLTVPAVAVGLRSWCGVEAWAGLAGLSRQHWKSGLVYAPAALVVAVDLGRCPAADNPPMFMNHHYATISGALTPSMVMILQQTVIPEELALGVLHGALNRAWDSKSRGGGFGAVRSVA